jgi:hypothetical protein
VFVLLRSKPTIVHKRDFMKITDTGINHLFTAEIDTYKENDIQGFLHKKLL